MPTIEEAVGADTPIAGVLAEGVKAISIQQEIIFTKYLEMILPLDGYRFWVKKAPAETFTARGSLHYASDTQQLSEESYALDRVVFTSLEEVFKPNQLAPTELWIGEFEGMMFAFSSRSSFYRQTNLFHYVGFAIYPDMMPQIVKNAASISTDQLIASNSMPLWLALNGYQPINAGAGFPNPARLYPAMLAPSNLLPPYGSVDISTDSTEGLAAAPSLSSNGSHDQLCTELVKVTLWGLRNADAQTFLDCVLAYSTNYNTFGIMNTPVIRDERRGQSETNTLAQKKSVTFQISYNQHTAREIARKLILSATSTMTVQG